MDESSDVSSSENEVNDKLFRMWKDLDDETLEKMKKITKEKEGIEEILHPLYYISKKAKNCLLFIGLNPSFGETMDNKELRKYDTLGTLRGLDDFYWEGDETSDSEKQKRLIKYYREIDNPAGDGPYYWNAENNVEYFEIMNEIASESGFQKYDQEKGWQHLDLFYFRMTKQDDVKKIIVIKKHKKKSKDKTDDEEDTIDLNPFAEEQWGMTKKLIEAMEPKIIVVTNTVTRLIFEKEFECKHLEIDKHFGTPTCKVGGKETPVFFTSMLSGQRALDRGSRERLKWHIRFVEKQMKDA